MPVLSPATPCPLTAFENYFSPARKISQEEKTIANEDTLAHLQGELRAARIEAVIEAEEPPDKKPPDEKPQEETMDIRELQEAAVAALAFRTRNGDLRWEWREGNYQAKDGETGLFVKCLNGDPYKLQIRAGSEPRTEVAADCLTELFEAVLENAVAMEPPGFIGYLNGQASLVEIARRKTRGRRGFLDTATFSGNNSNS